MLIQDSLTVYTRNIIRKRTCRLRTQPRPAKSNDGGKVQLLMLHIVVFENTCQRPITKYQSLQDHLQSKKLSQTAQLLFLLMTTPFPQVALQALAAWDAVVQMDEDDIQPYTSNLIALVVSLNTIQGAVRAASCPGPACQCVQLILFML